MMWMCMCFEGYGVVFFVIEMRFRRREIYFGRGFEVFFSEVDRTGQQQFDLASQ